MPETFPIPLHLRCPYCRGTGIRGCGACRATGVDLGLDDFAYDASDLTFDAAKLVFLLDRVGDVLGHVDHLTDLRLASDTFTLRVTWFCDGEVVQLDAAEPSSGRLVREVFEEVVLLLRARVHREVPT